MRSGDHRPCRLCIQRRQAFKPGTVNQIDRPARLPDPAPPLEFAQLPRDDLPRGAQFGSHLLMRRLDLPGATFQTDQLLRQPDVDALKGDILDHLKEVGNALGIGGKNEIPERWMRAVERL